MIRTDRKSHLLHFAISSSFMVFLATVYVASSATQQRIMSETMTPTANGVTWVQYYPEWFFQILALLVVATLIGWTTTVARFFGKPYPNRSQLASRKTTLISILLLNVLFLGTSHAISYPPFPFYQTYSAVIADVSTFFGVGLQQFYDFSAFLLVALLIISVSARYRRAEAETRVLAVGQLLSLTILPLGVEILAFDRSEWYLHVTQFQADYNVIAWFTNADLFYLTLALFVFTTIIRLSGKTALEEKGLDKDREGFR